MSWMFEKSMYSVNKALYTDSKQLFLKNNKNMAKSQKVFLILFQIRKKRAILGSDNFFAYIIQAGEH